MTTDAERVVLAEEYIHAAQQLAETTAVPDARTAWAHFVQSALIGAPRRAGAGVIHGQVLKMLYPADRVRGVPALPVVPIFPDDGDIGAEVRCFSEYAAAGAIYLPAGNAIILRAGHPETAFLRGCTLIHEAGHARRAFAEGRIGTAEPPGLTECFLQEEADMHLLTANLWCERGADAYVRLLDAGVCRIRKVLGKRVGMVLLENDEQWLDALDRVFGKAPTVGARNNRMLHLSIHLNFEVIARSGWRDPRRCRAEVIRKVYETYAPRAGQLF